MKIEMNGNKVGTEGEVKGDEGPMQGAKSI